MRALAGAGLAVAALVLTSSAQAGSFTNCGERTVGPNATKIIKAKGMHCGNARDLAADYEDQNFSSADDYPMPGDRDHVRRFECRFVTYFDPFEVAYECRHTRQKGKVMKALYPPEREGPAILRPLKKGCGSFRVSGLMTPIRVSITRGDFPCKIARRVMQNLFHGDDTGNWNCVGPQTGYAKCSKANRGTVVAGF